MSQWNSDHKFRITYRAFIATQLRLTDRVTDQERKYQHDEWRRIVEDFKPKNTPAKTWYRECINDLIRGYVNSSPEITRFLQDGIEFPEDQRRRIAYRVGLDYAMRNGLWIAEYRSIGEKFDKEFSPKQLRPPKEEDDDDDGA